MASHPARTSTYRSSSDKESGVLSKIVALFLGLLVVVLGFAALMMWMDARDARDGASTTSSAAHADHNTALPLNSFAGVVPENAAELAEAHTPYDAALPAAPAGDLVECR